MPQSLFNLPDAWPRLTLCGLDMIAGIIIIYLMQALTKNACFGGPAVHRWAMVRRIVFAIAAASLFTKGVWRIEKAQAVDLTELVTQAGIILGLTVFPVLRWLDVISQDELVEPRDKGAPDKCSAAPS